MYQKCRPITLTVPIFTNKNSISLYFMCFKIMNDAYELVLLVNPTHRVYN